MRITSGGDVGIGTTSPSLISGATMGAAINILNVYDSDAGARIAIQGLDASLDLVDIGATADQRWFSIYNDDQKTYFRTVDDDGSAVGLDIMTMDLSTGNVGIGTTSPSQMLEIKTTSGNADMALDAQTGQHTSYIEWQNGGFGVWQIGVTNTDGTFNLHDYSDSSTAVHVAQGGTSWVANSDARLKTNIVDMESRLEDILNIKVRRWENFKDNLGFVAQELYECIPEAVDVGTDEVHQETKDTFKKGALVKPWGVSRELLLPALVKAFQELSAKVEALENE